MSETEVAANYRLVEERVRKACERAGRNPEAVTLIAVSKTKPVEDIRELIGIGVKHFGENKVQEMCSKIEAIPEQLSWHLIGHLQRNKVKYIVGKTALIHSVDSFRLAEEIEKESAKADLITDVLIEVNIGNEESKSGAAAEEIPELIRQIALLSHVHICGLMCVAPAVDDPEEARSYFRKMRSIRDEVAAMALPNVDMKELSMGMTGDFEVAIEEGATIVRVGTAIFGRRNYAVQ